MGILEARGLKCQVTSTYIETPYIRFSHKKHLPPCIVCKILPLNMAETKIIYHIDEEETPYLVKLTIPPDEVTLADFKNVLNRPNYKFFFKSMDDDFGVVKEEIVDDEARLPCFNGRVISWLVSAESSISDSVSQCAESTALTDGRPSSFHPGHNRSMAEEYTTTETESVISSRLDGTISFFENSTLSSYFARIVLFSSVFFRFVY